MNAVWTSEAVLSSLRRFLLALLVLGLCGVGTELVALAQRAPEGRRGWLIEDINGKPAGTDPASRYLLEAGLTATSMGLQLRVPRQKAED